MASATLEGDFFYRGRCITLWILHKLNTQKILTGHRQETHKNRQRGVKTWAILPLSADREAKFNSRIDIKPEPALALVKT